MNLSGFLTSSAQNLKNHGIAVALFFAICWLGVVPAFAVMNAGITYQGRIVKPDGLPLTGQSVQFKFQIRTPNASNCLFYEETQSRDMRLTSGQFSLTLNDGTGYRTPGVLVADGAGAPTSISLDRIFANRGGFTFDSSTCSGSNTWSPSADDGRVLAVLFKDETMSVWEPIPNQSVNFVPLAIESMQVGGFKAPQLVRIVEADGSPSLSTVAPLSNAEYTKLLALAQTPVTSGQVVGWNGSSWASVDPVASVSAFAKAALPMCAGGAYLRNNGSGLFECTTPAVGGGGTVTSVTAGAGLSGGTITASGTIGIAAGGVGSTELAANAVATAKIADGAVSTVKIADGSVTDVKLAPDSVTSAKILDGTIGAADLSPSLNLNTSGTLSSRGVIVYPPATGSFGVTLNAPAGLGANYVMTLPAGQSVGSQALVNNGSGVLSWASLSAGSQWTTQAPGINYMAGNVGIGTTSPVTKLEIVGSVRVGDGGEACSSTIAGAIRYNGGNLQFCNGTPPWTTLGLAGSGISSLTGDVTGTGPGAATTTITANAITTGKIANTAVTYAKIQDVANGKILGRSTSGAGSVEELSIGTGLSLASGTLSSNVTDTDTFAAVTAACANTFVPYKSGGAWTCLQVSSANANSTLVSRDATGNLAANVATFNGVTLNNGGSLLNIVNPIGGAWTLTLPATAGANNQVLTTNGSGLLSWSTPAGGSQWATQAPGINYTSGNVGIGTTSASSKLTVSSSSYPQVLVSAPSGFASTQLDAPTGANAAIQVFTHSLVNRWTTGMINTPESGSGDGSDFMIYRHNDSGTMQGTPPFSIARSNGYVGVNTTTPVAPFDIGANAIPALGLTSVLARSSGDPLFLLSTKRGVATNVNGDIATSVGLSYNNSGTFVENSNIRFHRGAGTTGGFMSFSTSANDERMRIDAGGNVGIGTTSPGYKLDVAGPVNATQFLVGGVDIGAAAGAWTVASGNVYRASGNVGIGSTSPSLPLTVTASSPSSSVMKLQNYSYNGYSGINIYDVYDSNVGYMGYGNSSTSAPFQGNMYLGSSTNVLLITSGTERLRVTSGGNVGIGTTSPNGLLDVKGTFAMSGATSGYVGFVAPAVASPTIWTLPSADGSNGQVLSTNGSGLLSWATVAGGGMSSLTGDVTGSGSGAVTTTVSQVGGASAANVAAGANLANGSTALNTNSAIIRRDGSGNFSSNTATFNTLALNNAGSVVNLVNPVGAAYTLNLPTSLGSNGQFLSTNGSGLTSWSNFGGANIVIGTGDGTAALGAGTLRGPAAVGTNISGVNLYVDASVGTGLGNSGNLIFRTGAGAGFLPALTLDARTILPATSATYTTGQWLITFNHTVQPNANRVLVLQTSVSSAGAVSSVKWGATAMTKFSTNGAHDFWYLVAPATGTNAITITLTSAYQLAAVANSYYNANQITPLVSGVASSPSVANYSTPTSVSSGELLLENFAIFGSAAPASGQTLLTSQNFSSRNFYFTAAAGPLSSVSWTNASAGIVYLSAIVKPSAGEGSNGLTERLLIDPSGNVGIGTTLPGSRLTVAGSIESTSGGIKFPDGTTQTTAAISGGGGSSILMGSVSNTTAASSTQFAGFGYTSNHSSETIRRMILPRPGVIKNLYLITSSSQPADGDLVVTLRKNGIDTQVTFTIPAGSANGAFSDTTHSVSFAAGDIVTLKMVNASASPSANTTSFSAEMQF